MGVVSHDISVLAGAWLSLVGIYHEVLGAPVGNRHIHEGPLQTGRETGSTAATQSRIFNLLLDPFGSLLYYLELKDVKSDFIGFDEF